MKSMPIISLSIFLIVSMAGCIHKQNEIGEPGSSVFVFRLQYFVEKNTFTGITDTIYPLSKSDSLTIFLTGRVQIYLGDEEKINVNYSETGTFSYQLETPCQNQIGASYNVLSSGDSLIYDFRGGSAIFWKIPLWEVASSFDQCENFGWFDWERIDY
jgi:hypothetical protein